MTIMVPGYYNTAQAAEYLGITVGAVRNYVYHGRLKGIRAGWEWLIPKEVLDDYRDNRRPPGPRPGENPRRPKR